MTTAAVQIPFATASPAELREAILPEDVDQFDVGYRRALDVAAQILRLDELESFLGHWRRVARSANAYGHDHWRAVLARAEHTLRTGERPPGAVSMEEMQARIQARLANA